MSESMGLETLIFLILMKHTPQSSAIAPASPKAPTGLKGTTVGWCSKTYMTHIDMGR